MATNPQPYQKLPGAVRRSGLFAVSAPRSTLYLGSDHLLSLDSTLSEENCRRFYFRDIEALVIARTNGRRNWNFFWGIVALLCFWAFVSHQGFRLGTPGKLFLSMEAGGILGLAATVLALVVLTTNSLLGPMGKASIRTAVQIEDLPTLRRVRRALKVFGRLRPLILEAQGSAGPEQIAAADWSVSPVQTSGRRPMAEPMSALTPQALTRHEPGHFHTALFCLMLVDAVVSFWSAGHLSETADLINTAGVLAGVFLLIFALRRQLRSDLPVGVKRLAWTVAIYYSVSMSITGAMGAVYAVQQGEKAAPALNSALHNIPGWREVTIGLGAVALLIGVAGLSLLLARKKSLPPSAPGQA